VNHAGSRALRYDDRCHRNGSASSCSILGFASAFTAEDEMNLGRSLFGTAAVSCAGLVCGAEPPGSNARPNDVLLLDYLGNAVRVPTNALPKGMLPPAAVGLEHQFPVLLEGANPPPEVRGRHAAALEGLTGFDVFPAVSPWLMPYLAGVDEFGNTAFKPGPLIPSTPVELVCSTTPILAVRTRPALQAGAELHLPHHERRDAGRQHHGLLHPGPEGEVERLRRSRRPHRWLDQHRD
jgi:hypothetical protein